MRDSIPAARQRSRKSAGAPRTSQVRRSNASTEEILLSDSVEQAISSTADENGINKDEREQVKTRLVDHWLRTRKSLENLGARECHELCIPFGILLHLRRKHLERAPNGQNVLPRNPASTDATITIPCSSMDTIVNPALESGIGNFHDYGQVVPINRPLGNQLAQKRRNCDLEMAPIHTPKGQDNEHCALNTPHSTIQNGEKILDTRINSIGGEEDGRQTRRAEFGRRSNIPASAASDVRHGEDEPNTPKQPDQSYDKDDHSPACSQHGSDVFSDSARTQTRSISPTDPFAFLDGEAHDELALWSGIPMKALRNRTEESINCKNAEEMQNDIPLDSCGDFMFLAQPTHEREEKRPRSRKRKRAGNFSSDPYQVWMKYAQQKAQKGFKRFFFDESSAL